MIQDQDQEHVQDLESGNQNEDSSWDKSVDGSDEESGCGLLEICIAVLLVAVLAFTVWKVKFSSKASALKGGETVEGGENHESLVSGETAGEENKSWLDQENRLGYTNKQTAIGAAVGTTLAVGAAVLGKRYLDSKGKGKNKFTYTNSGSTGESSWMSQLEAMCPDWESPTGMIVAVASAVAGGVGVAYLYKWCKSWWTGRNKSAKATVSPVVDNKKNKRRNGDKNTQKKPTQEQLAEQKRVELAKLADAEAASLNELSRQADEVQRQKGPCGHFTLRSDKLPTEEAAKALKRMLFEDSLNKDNKPVLKYDVPQCGLRAGDILLHFKFFWDATRKSPKKDQKPTKNCQTFTKWVETWNNFHDKHKKEWKNKLIQVAGQKMQRSYATGDKADTYQLIEMKFQRNKKVVFQKDATSSITNDAILKIFKTGTMNLCNTNRNKILNKSFVPQKKEKDNVLFKTLRDNGIRENDFVAEFTTQGKKTITSSGNSKWHADFCTAVTSGNEIEMLISNNKDMSKSILAGFGAAKKNTKKSSRRLTALAGRFERVCDYQTGFANES